MREQMRTQAVEVGEHGLKKHDIRVSTVVFMIFCLVAAGRRTRKRPECGPGLTTGNAMYFHLYGDFVRLVASELALSGRRKADTANGRRPGEFWIPGQVARRTTSIYRQHHTCHPRGWVRCYRMGYEPPDGIRTKIRDDSDIHDNQYPRSQRRGYQKSTAW